VRSGITEPAPIALFVYKRPEHALRAATSLLACDDFDESPMYVFADGPKSEAEGPAVQETRAAMRELLGTRATFVEQERNRGLAQSIIAGTTELCERHGKAIVVEDDLLVARAFVRFLNEGLERFRNEPRVMQVAGHIPNVPSLADQREALFLPMTSSFGWATWKRAWDLFDPAATGWRERLTGQEVTRFNLGGQYDYARMLENQMTRGIDSWAIRWYYSVFANDGLVLYPPRALAVNTGQDGSGTHGRLRRGFQQELPCRDETISMPDEVVVSPSTTAVFKAVGRTNRFGPGRLLRSLILSRAARLSPQKERKGGASR
jgi:hypothetical protein